MVNRLVAWSVLFGTLALGDVITLKNGKRVEGTFLSADSRQIRLAIEERVESIPISDISEIRFGSTEPVVAAAPATHKPIVEARPADPAPVAEVRPVERARSGSLEVPSGTALTVRMIDDIDSERDRLGQEFKASVDEAVVVNGETLIPRGANVLAKLVDDKQSGKLSGRTELTVDLVSVEINGRMVEVATQEVTQASESRTGNTGKVVGGAVTLGAVIGAIAGGGKGAAIGAVTGAAAGGAVQVMTKGQRVRISSESRLTFNLQQPLRMEMAR